MATLHVRNVPDDLYEALRARAAVEGRSIAAQAITILARELEAKEREARAVRRRFRLSRRSVRPSERLGQETRLALTYAQEEASKLGHGYLGTEHLLLGLLRDAEGAATAILDPLGVTLDAVRVRIVEHVGEGESATQPPFPLTPRMKRVLELGLREALALGEEYVGGEHVLIGIFKEEDGVAAQILRELGVDEGVVRVGALRGHQRMRAWPTATVEMLTSEYQVVTLEGSDDECSSALNDLAANGWELLSMAGDRAIFQRRTDR